MLKDEKYTCKACKNTVFHCQICKFVEFLLPSTSWLLKLPNVAHSEEKRTCEKIRGSDLILRHVTFYNIYKDKVLFFLLHYYQELNSDLKKGVSKGCF